MKYLSFRQQMNPFGIFSIEDIRKKDSEFDTRRLVEWQQKRYIKKIVNRWYMFTDMDVSEQVLFAIANKMYAPSYISFESALSWYGLIPEGVFSITSATTKKTKTFDTDPGTFMYHRLKPDLFFGYTLESFHNHTFKIADPEKTILDYLYIHNELSEDADFEGWRINGDQLSSIIHKDKLKLYLDLFGSKALRKRIQNLFNYIDHAQF